MSGTERKGEAVHEQNWQGKLISATSEDESLNFDGCFWWLSGWKQCPTHAVAGNCEFYEQFLPTRLYTCQKTHTDTTGEVMSRLCNKAPERGMSWLVVQPLHRTSTLPNQHNAALKILFLEILQHLGLVYSVSPWYSPLKPKPVYEANNAEAFWDVPLLEPTE